MARRFPQRMPRCCSSEDTIKQLKETAALPLPAGDSELVLSDSAILQLGRAAVSPEATKKPEGAGCAVALRHPAHGRRPASGHPAVMRRAPTWQPPKRWSSSPRRPAQGAAGCRGRPVQSADGARSRSRCLNRIGRASWHQPVPRSGPRTTWQRRRSASCPARSPSTIPAAAGRCGADRQPADQHRHGDRPRWWGARQATSTARRRQHWAGSVVGDRQALNRPARLRAQCS